MTNKEELVAYLKDHLSVRISSSGGSYYNSASIKVELYLDDECISTDSCGIPVQNDKSY